MKRFVKNIIALSILVVLTAYAVCTMRCVHWWLTSAELDVPAGTRILCIGSSQIGCSIEKRSGWHLLWRPSVPIQFAWMRLENLEKRGVLNDVKVLLTDFSYATIGVQQDDNLERYWTEMLPVSWDSAGKIPVSPLRLYSNLLTHVMDKYEVSSLGDRIDPGVTLAGRDLRWLDEQWLRNTRNHDAPDSTLNPSWKSSLETALRGMKNICAKRRIRFVVVIPPMSAFYRSRLSVRSQARLAEMKSFMKAIGIEVVDASACLPDAAFIDLVHLSSAGAHQFTEWIIKEASLDVCQ